MATLLVSVMNILSPNKPNMTGEYLRQNRWTLLFEGSDGIWFERNIVSIGIPSLTFDIEEWWNGVAPRKLASQGKFGNTSLIFYASMQILYINGFLLIYNM